MELFYVFVLLLYCLDKFITLEKIVRTDLIDFDVFMIDVGGTIVFPHFVCRTRRLVCLGFYDSVNIMLFFDQSILNHLYVLQMVLLLFLVYIVFIVLPSIGFFFAFYLPSLGEVLLNVLEVSHTASKVYSHMEPVFSHGPQSMSEILVRSKIW